MRLLCSKCGAENPEEVYFCLRCRASLVPKTSYDLNASDFIYGPDLDAIRTLNATGPLPYILKNLTLGDFEKKAATQLAVSQKVLYPSELDAIVRQSSVLLSLQYMPEVFVADADGANAFTFGSEEHPYMVITTPLLRILTDSELTAVISHELGHVKSGHMLYHTLAEVLGGGLSLTASLMGLNLISVPIRFALLSWQRESEITADRTSLLVANDIEVLKSLLAKLAFGSESTADIQGEKQSGPGVLESASELFRTHPLHSNRFRRVKEFSESEQFLTAKKKIERRQRLIRGLVPVCRFCGGLKQPEELFCPKCGKCQT